MHTTHFYAKTHSEIHILTVHYAVHREDVFLDAYKELVNLYFYNINIINLKITQVGWSWSPFALLFEDSFFLNSYFFKSGVFCYLSAHSILSASLPFPSPSSPTYTHTHLTAFLPRGQPSDNNYSDDELGFLAYFPYIWANSSYLRPDFHRSIHRSYHIVKNGM